MNDCQLMTDSGATEFLSPQGLADYLGVPVGTVYQWRYRGVGPRGSSVGRHVRYRRRDVDAWLEQQAQQQPA
jgi:excisionase family DNA binding protein